MKNSSKKPLAKHKPGFLKSRHLVRLLSYCATRRVSILFSVIILSIGAGALVLLGANSGLPLLGSILIFVGGVLTGAIFLIRLVSSATKSISQQLERASSYIYNFEIGAGGITRPQVRPIRTGIENLDTLAELNEKTLAYFFLTLEEIGDSFTDIVERYETLTSNIAAAVIVQDIDDNTVFCSPYTEVLTGYTPDEVSECEKDFLETLVVPEDREKFIRFRTMSEMGEAIPVRYRIRHKSGIVLWLESRLIPVHDSSGEVTAVMSLSIDVTTNVRYQSFIEEQNQDLSDFAYMVSHDLKAPIFTIKGMANALCEDYGNVLGKEGTSLLDYISEGTNRLEALVASIIEYSSLSKEVPDTEVNLNIVVSDVLKDLQEQLSSSDARVNIESSLPCVFGPPVRLYQVFSNLIGNAVKYRDPSRPAIITITSKLSSDRHNVIIDIADNGIGIPSEKLNDVFRPYHRACASDVEGTGVGLACVKKIIDRLGGMVAVRSKEGEGSTFSLIIPSPNPKPKALPPELARTFQE